MDGAWPRADRPPVQKGSVGGAVRPASARPPGGASPSRSALVSDTPGLVLPAGMCTVGLLPKEVTDSLTQQLEEREGGGGLFCLLQIFFKAGVNPMAIFLWYFGL